MKDREPLMNEIAISCFFIASFSLGVFMKLLRVALDNETFLPTLLGERKVKISPVFTKFVLWNNQEATSDGGPIKGAIRTTVPHGKTGYVVGELETLDG